MGGGIVCSLIFAMETKDSRNTTVGLILTFLHTYINAYILTYIHACTCNRSWAKVESNKELEYAQASAAIESDNTNTNLRARHQKTSSTGTYIKQIRYALIHTYMYWINSKHTLGIHFPIEYTYTVLFPHIHTSVYSSIQF